MTAGTGDGPLSSQALARLERPAAASLRPPDLADFPAIDRWRAEVHAAWIEGDPDAEECGHAEVELGGVRCLAAGPAPGERTDPTGRGVVVYLHGGGYALGSPEVALPITERLAVTRPVVSIDYRLAPEHPYPSALDDIAAVLGSLHASDPERPMILAGDSAGANLALATALANPGHLDWPPLAGLLLFSPHLDHGGRGDRHELDPTSDTDPAASAWLSCAYRGGIPAEDPRVSPLRARLRGLPPTLVQAGGIDAALRYAIRFARRARVGGSDVTLDVWDGLWHTWHYHRDLPEADRALQEAGAFAGKVLAAARR